MRRSISKLAIILILTAANSAPSKTQEKIVVDMGKLTCGELNKLGFQDFAGVTMWLSSYYNASINNTGSSWKRVGRFESLRGHRARYFRDILHFCRVQNLAQMPDGKTIETPSAAL